MQYAAARTNLSDAAVQTALTNFTRSSPGKDCMWVGVLLGTDVFQFPKRIEHF